MTQFTRRRFLQISSLAGGSLLLTGTRASGAVNGANDRFRVAVVGLNGRGQAHLSNYLGKKDIEVAYVVDPDSNVLNNALKGIAAKTEGQSQPKGVSDIRTVLDDPNVDAVSIATPNHWHSLMTIWAAQAGKHVYVEKPMSHDIEEGRIAVAAQKKYGVVVQHGTQNRSDPKVAGLQELIHAGKFGKLKISYGYCCKTGNRGNLGMQPATDPPANLDWNLWKGPAVIDHYHKNFVHYNWHWFWKTGNGDLNNQGTHQLDIARWALDPELTHPVRAMAIGGRFLWNDQGETPNTMMGIAEYPNGQKVFFNVRNINYDGYQTQVENEYYFEDGGKIVKGHYYPAGSETGEPIEIPNGKVTGGGNFGSFITACRANDSSLVNADALTAHQSCVLGHLMNNSYRLGTKVPFNAKAGRFGDDKDAYEHFLKLHDIMKNGVGVPEDEAEYVVGPWLTFDPVTERHTGDHADAANALLKDPNNAGFEVPTVNDV
ncbi:Gfo/Idh/MocA family protein [Planctomicrobium sp. SH661]|uniref:Gfo/Idh/MocA family protein n=1 Tax=Planctomicrobium sp. SH661 TaxID=3448124 RepID=UPI003F5C92BE